jgi:hypothetical protein
VIFQAFGRVVLVLRMKYDPCTAVYAFGGGLRKAQALKADDDTHGDAEQLEDMLLGAR